MKRVVQFNRVLTLLLMALTTSIAWAQPDLSVSSFENPYQFQGDGQTKQVTFEISNTGDAAAGDGIQLDLTIVEPNQLLSFDLAAGVPYVFGNWNCNLISPQNLDCLFQANLAAFSGTTSLDVPVVVQPGSFDFAPAMSLLVSDVGNVEVNTSDNNYSLDISFAGGLPDLSTSMAFSNGFASPFDPVDPISVDVTVTNNGGDATSVALAFDGEEFNFNQNASDPACFFGQNGIECMVSSLFSGQSQTFTLAGVVNQTAAAGTYNLNANVTSFEGDAFPSDNLTSMTYDINGPGAPEINIDKFVWDGLSASGPVTELPQNGVAEYLVYVHNEGTADAINVDLTDTLPADVTYDASLNGGNNPQYFQEMIGSCGFTGNTLTCNIPTVSAGASQNLVKIFARVTGNPGATVTNNVMTNFADANLANNNASATFTITGTAIPVDLEVDAFTDQNFYSQGQSFPIHVVASNLASVDDADFVTVTTQLPQEVQYQSINVDTNIWACSHDGSLSGGVVTCDSGSNLIVGFSNHPMDINVLAVQQGNGATFDATVSSSTTPDPDLSNNNVSNNFNVTGGFNDLAITKTVSSTNVNIGDAFDYQIAINHNTTPSSDVNDIIIQDNLPAEVSYQGFTQNSTGVVFSCNHDGSPTGGMVTCDSGNAAFTISDALDLSIHVQAESNGTANNTASFTSLGDGSPGNNSSIAPAVTISIPFTSVNVSKQAIMAGVPVTDVPLGSDFSYQLNVNNTGAFKVFNLDVVDSLPNDVSLVSYDGGADWACSDALVGGQTEVGCSFNGDMAISANSSITINVTATNDANVTSITNQMDASALNLTGVQSAQSTVTLVNPSLNVSTTQTPDPVDAGEPVEYTILVENDGTQDLNNIDVQSVLPQGIDFVSADNPFGNCTHNNGTVDCAIGSVAVAGSKSVKITANTPQNPDINNSYTNLITVNSPDLPQAVSAQWDTQITPPPLTDYNLVFSASPLVLELNDNGQMVFEIRNIGNVTLNPVNFQINIDPAINIQSVVGGDFNCQIVGQSVNCNNQLPLLAGDTFTGHVVVNAGAVAGEYVHNISALANGINKTAQTSQHVVDRSNVVDVQLSKTASVSEITDSHLFDYHFNVINVGQMTASGITLTDTLPEGLEFDGYRGQGWQCQGTQVIECQYTPSVLPNASATELSFGVSAHGVSGQIVNVATVQANNDSNPSNNTDSVVVQIVGVSPNSADLSIIKTASADEITAGDSLSWDIKVQNHGPDSATQIIIQDDFPVGFIADSIMQGSQMTCMLLTDSLSCEQASLASGSSVLINISGHVDMNYQGEMMNLATVSSASTDGNSNNNQSMAQLHVNAYQPKEADVSVQVTSNQNQILQGDVFQININAKNAGPDAAENTMISAQISGLIDQINPINVSPWQCQTNQSNIQCHLPMPMAHAMQYDLAFEVRSEQIVQTAQAIQVAVDIMSDATDPNIGNNQALLNTQVTPTPTEEEILSHMQGVMGSMDAQTERAIQNVSSYCARAFYWAMEEGMCARMYSSTQEDHDQMHDMMREITPNEVLGQSNSASEIITSQFTNIDSRLAELRGGGGGFSVSGLRATYGNESIPIGMLAYLNAGEDDQTQNAVNDFVSPWGFFINGTISMGERDKTGRELGFDFDTFGITAGLDYRLSNSKVLGVALGYANFDSEIEDEAEMQSDGVTLTGYGSFYINDNFYVDTRISYGQPKFEQSRRINFTLDDITIDRVAKGDTSANQYSASMSMGYHFYKNAWNITPNASINYVNTSIDAFTESGAGGFNFQYARQDIKSLKASLGLSVSRAFSLEKGVITPQFDINMTREMENDGGLIEARFIDAPDDEIFWIETDEPDRTFGNAGLGLVFIGANGKQAYINYRSIFGLEGFSRGTLNLGLRFEF